MAEYDDVMRILRENADKMFVKRILTPNKYPKLDLGNGEFATHKMSWGSIDTDKGKKYVVFPTVLMNKDQKLVDYGDKAWDAVSKTNDFIIFNDPKTAEWFSNRYKAAWGQ